MRSAFREGRGIAAGRGVPAREQQVGQAGQVEVVRALKGASQRQRDEVHRRDERGDHQAQHLGLAEVRLHKEDERGQEDLANQVQKLPVH